VSGKLKIVEEKKTTIDPKKKFKIRGIIKDTLPGTLFRVEVTLKEKSFIVLAHISGKMRMHYIKLQKGDEVEVEMTPYDLEKGRITYRY